jgi:hypothetical protein
MNYGCRRRWIHWFHAGSVPLEHGYEVDVDCVVQNRLPKTVRVIQKDLFDCQKDFAGYDQIIFLAGLSNDPMAEFNLSLNFRSMGHSPPSHVAKLVGVKRYLRFLVLGLRLHRE